ncbi:hypothetical protein GPM19_04940 [Halomonas sp. ZH2S]|uniref:Uncharacterized protein n=1 Tax=Vreelandella zhuhanensis TaxID=2684210 RepID=A0A7X3GZ47_9GAMM|nr:hypothetical protein [Halomonas zhuhanensis]MWJ27560.1 hypothetical protein [Halomonas zhuhanensis]
MARLAGGRVSIGVLTSADRPIVVHRRNLNAATGHRMILGLMTGAAAKVSAVHRCITSCAASV